MTGGGPGQKMPDELDYVIEALIPMEFSCDTSLYDSDRDKR